MNQFSRTNSKAVFSDEQDLYLYAEHGPVFSTREPHDNLRAAGILLPAVMIGAALAVAALVFFLR